MTTAGTEPSSMPKRARSCALPLAVALIVGGLWLGWAYYNFYWAGRNANTATWDSDEGIRLCKLELSLRTVAVCRFAERTGALPETLADCSEDVINIDEWLAWAKEEYKPGADRTLDEILTRDRYLLAEPWSPLPVDLSEAVVAIIPRSASRPGCEQDLFGLPILYRRTPQGGADGASVNSSDPLRDEIAKFLLASGTIPPPPPEAFTLTSLYIRDFLGRLRPLKRSARLALFLLIVPTALIVLATVLYIRKRKLESPGALGTLLIVVSGVAGAIAFFFGWAGTQATCYIPSGFSSSRLSRQERIAILDDAVNRGEVSDSVATTAREYIDKLPERPVW